MTGMRSMLSNNSYHLVQGSVPSSQVQRGRVGIPGDFSVLEVHAVEITEGIYDLSPQNCSWSCSTVTTPQATQGRHFDTLESSVDRDAGDGCSGIGFFRDVED